MKSHSRVIPQQYAHLCRANCRMLRKGQLSLTPRNSLNPFTSGPQAWINHTRSANISDEDLHAIADLTLDYIRSSPNDIAFFLQGGNVDHLGALAVSFVHFESRQSDTKRTQRVTKHPVKNAWKPS